MSDMTYRTPDTAVEPASLPPAPQEVGESDIVPAGDEAPAPLSASEGQHPFALSPEEGLPAVPQDVLLKKLAGLVSLKLGAVTMYTVYSDAIRAPFRDSLAEHFNEHAAEERGGVYDYSMKIIALGGRLATKSTRPPEANGLQEILTAVIQFEKGILEATRGLLAVCGDYAGLRLLLEDNLLKDQRHLDDARRMLVLLP